VSVSAVQHIWRKHGIKPQRLELHMVSNDSDFETKAADVIGLYLNPPAHAAVFCVDEKTAIPCRILLRKTSREPRVTMAVSMMTAPCRRHNLLSRRDRCRRLTSGGNRTHAIHQTTVVQTANTMGASADRQLF
jgi:hypothetical protein